MPTVATVQLRPDRFAAGGEAIARDADGRVVFVRGALPGETVTAELIHEKRDWARAHVVDVVEASTDRVTPPCRVAARRLRRMRLDAPRPRCAASRQVGDRRGGAAAYGRTRRAGDDSRARRRCRGLPHDGRVAPGPDGAAGFRAERSHDVVAAPRASCSTRRCASCSPRSDSIPASRRRCGCPWRRAMSSLDGIGPRAPYTVFRPRCSAAVRRRSSKTSTDTGCGCRSARSSSRARRLPRCSSMPCAAPRRNSSTPRSSSTPTPESGCLPSAPRRPRPTSSPSRPLGRRLPTPR